LEKNYKNPDKLVLIIDNLSSYVILLQIKVDEDQI